MLDDPSKTLHDDWALAHELADLARRQGFGWIVHVGDPAFGKGQGDADGAEPVFGVKGVARAEASQFGHAPKLQ